METAWPPLRIMDCSLLIRSLGRSAQNLRELRDHLAGVPEQSLSHHFYDSLLRPTFDHPEFRNDLARWAARHLRDEPLAERLAVTDPLDFSDLEQLRQHLLDLIEDRLSEVAEVPQAPRGKEFHFLTSQFVIADTGLSAKRPSELAALIPVLSTGSVFFHFIDARRRPPLRRDDFSFWLEGFDPDLRSVREDLQSIDCYQWSLTELRERIASCFESLGGDGGAR
jgi:hypothetical protein